MKHIIFIAFFVWAFSGAYAQTASDSIETQKTNGTIFLQHGKTLTPKELKEIVKVNPEASEELKIASGNLGAGMAFAYVGGFMIGWPIGTAIGGGKPAWAMAGAGVVLAAISIPFATAANRHTKNAVKIYNNGIKQISHNKTNLNLGFSGNGIGVRLSF
jgi:hypothetical protein